MINIYMRNLCQSSNKALAWLEEYGLNPKIRNVKYISRQELMEILTITDNGFLDILKSPEKIVGDLQEKYETFNMLNFNEAIYFLQRNTDLLKSPLIFDSNKLLVGFNKEEIRKFLPSKHSRLLDVE